MKKLFFIFFFLGLYSIANSQNREIISQNEDEMITQKQVYVAERWVKDKSSNSYNSKNIASNGPGNFGFSVYGGGMFLSCLSNDISNCGQIRYSSGYLGCNVFYNFSDKFGISAAYDYTFSRNVTLRGVGYDGRDSIFANPTYSDVNAGIILHKYFSIGASFQLKPNSSNGHVVIGPYIMFYLPVGQKVCIVVNGKYMFNGDNRWAVGCGLAFKFPVKS